MAAMIDSIDQYLPSAAMTENTHGELNPFRRLKNRHILIIFSYLGALDLSSASQVSRKFRKIAYKKVLWLNKLSKGCLRFCQPEHPRLHFIEAYTLLKQWTSENPYFVCQQIHNMHLFDEEVFILTAKKIARVNGAAISKYIHGFCIRPESARADIAALAIEDDAAETSYYIENYELTDQERLTALAKRAASLNGFATSAYIQNYNIHDEQSRALILLNAAKESGYFVIRQLNNYQIENDNVLDMVEWIAWINTPRPLQEQMLLTI
jgi:hypothetical protein